MAPSRPALAWGPDRCVVHFPHARRLFRNAARQKARNEARHASPVHQSPEHYDHLIGDFPDGFAVASQTRGIFDFIHVFCLTEADLRKRLPPLKKALAKGGTLWISWPRESSPLARDLNRDGVRTIALSTGLVDVKICAVDENWSGLKFVWRKKNRG